MACSACAAAKKLAANPLPAHTVRQIPSRAVVTPSTVKRAEFTSRMKYVGKR